jgi:hypothetical protein
MSFGKQVGTFATMIVGVVIGQMLVRRIFGGGRRYEQQPAQQPTQYTNYNDNNSNNYSQKPNGNFKYNNVKDMYSGISNSLSGNDKRH